MTNTTPAPKQVLVRDNTWPETGVSVGVKMPLRFYIYGHTCGRDDTSYRAYPMRPPPVGHEKEALVLIQLIEAVSIALYRRQCEASTGPLRELHTDAAVILLPDHPTIPIG